MKRFRWRLQRVLDITAKREQALRLELFALARALVRVRQEIVARQAAVRTLLADLGRRTLVERLAEQTVVLACAAAEERILRGLRRRVADLEAQRAEKTRRFRQVRATRQTLERLREEARHRYLREMAAREQAQFDEVSHIAFARRERPRMAGVAG